MLVVLLWLALFYLTSVTAQPAKLTPIPTATPPTTTYAPTGPPDTMCFAAASIRDTPGRRLLSDEASIDQEIVDLIARLGADAGILSEEADLTGEWALSVLDIVLAVAEMTVAERDALTKQRDVNRLSAATFTALIDETDSGFAKVASDIDELSEFTNSAFKDIVDAVNANARSEAMHTAYTRSVSVYNDEQVALLTERGRRARDLFRTPDAVVANAGPISEGSRIEVYRCEPTSNQVSLAVKICRLTSRWVPSFLGVLGLEGSVLMTSENARTCQMAHILDMSANPPTLSRLREVSDAIVSYTIAIMAIPASWLFAPDEFLTTQRRCDLVGRQDASALLNRTEEMPPSVSYSIDFEGIFNGSYALVGSSPYEVMVSVPPPFSSSLQPPRVQLTAKGRELLAWNYDLSVSYYNLTACQNLDRASAEASLRARSGVRETWGVSGAQTPYTDEFANYVLSTQGSSFSVPDPLVAKEYHRQRRYFNSSVVRSLLANLVDADADFDAAVSYVDLAMQAMLEQAETFRNATADFATMEQRAAARHNATRQYVDRATDEVKRAIKDGLSDTSCDSAVSDFSVLGVLSTVMVGSTDAFCGGTSATRSARVREATTLACWSSDFPSLRCLGSYVAASVVAVLSVGVLVLLVRLGGCCAPVKKEPMPMRIF